MVKPGPSQNAESQPGPASGPAQNINGSEHQGRKAREDFVTKTLNSASDQVDTPPQPPGSTQAPTTTAARAAAQAGDSDDETSGQQPPVPNASSANEDVNMEDEPDVEELKRLKQLYRSRPTKALKDAFRSMLEELSDDAEAEEDLERIKRRKRTVGLKPQWDDDDFICTDGPRQRDERRVALSVPKTRQGYIRITIDELLKITDKNKLPPGPPPEVAAPTTAAFYFKWGESEKSEFNAIAARIIALRVVKDWPTLFEIDEVFELAQGHFKYLRTCYRRQNVPEAAAKETQRHRSANKTTRKHTLYNHRLRIIKEIPALRRYGRLIQTLGIDGTSSDEDTTRPGVYSVRRKPQLSSRVQNLKRQLDQAYAIHFKGPGTKGNQLRQRIDSGLVSTALFKIKGLPVSCMDQAWLATLPDVRKDMLEFLNHEYDFSFPVELLDAP
ncbi:hypothetical protein FRC06_002727 [Ceratobasidium sp. 370]|nr:hypothetical protein FRC06_002727 [Ceratobasidium sp. 370]